MAGCLTTGWLAKESAGSQMKVETQSQNCIRGAAEYKSRFLVFWNSGNGQSVPTG